MDKVKQIGSKIGDSAAVKATKEKAEELKQKMNEKTQEAMAKMGLTPGDVDKLEKIPLVVGFAGLVVWLVGLTTRFTVSWAKGIALYNGEPVPVFVSLDSAMFGQMGEYTAKLTSYNCPPGLYCPLDTLAGDCSASSGAYPVTGAPTTTPEATWCSLKLAGAATSGLLWFVTVCMFFLALSTLVYAAKVIPCVQEKIFSKVEAVIGDTVLKTVISAMWAAMTVFMYIAMTVYASNIPDSLGTGSLELESSFGVLRLCFLVNAVLTALLVAHFFDMYHAENTAEAYTEYVETKFFTWKKQLYNLLILQMLCYMITSIYGVHWEMLLVFICGYYLDAKKENFKLIYVVLVSVTILLDGIDMFAFPDFASMTPGQSFTKGLFIFIFVLKIATLGVIYMYSKEEDSSFARLGDPDPEYDAPGSKLEDEIAE